MVDREARHRYRELLRQFISGRMTNDEYEERFNDIECDGNDPAVYEAYHQAWFLYDDIITHRMTGSHRLNREDRRAIARAVLFLQSDQEYGWPKDGMFGMSLTLLLVAEMVVCLFLFALFPAHFLPVIGGAAVLGAILFAHFRVRTVLEKRIWDATGDIDAWPFLRQADMEEAARHPRLLNGEQDVERKPLA